MCRVAYDNVGPQSPPAAVVTRWVWGGGGGGGVAGNRVNLTQVMEIGPWGLRNQPRVGPRVGPGLHQVWAILPGLP